MLLERKLTVVSILSAIALTSIVIISEAHYAPSPYEDLETQVFNPEETYGLLKILQVYYKNRTDVQSSLRRSRLNDLTWVKELNDAKCSSSSWNKYLNIIEKFDDQKLSLLPFLLKAKDDLAEYCANSTRNWYSSDLKTIRELDKKLFGDSKDDPLKTNEVYKSLNDLQSLIADFTHKAYVKKKEDIRNLLDISQLDIDKCTNETLIQFNDLLDQYDTNNQTSSIQSYVLSWKGKHEEYCREWEAEKVKIANMTDGSAIYATLFGENAVPTKNQTIREMLAHLTFLLQVEEDLKTVQTTQIPYLYMNQMTGEIEFFRPTEYSKSPEYKLTEYTRLSSPRKENIERLNSLRHRIIDICSLESWNDFLVLLERNKNERINIIPYLMYAKQGIANFCRGKVLISQTYFDSDPFDWKPYYELVFSHNNSTVLEPTETIIHLQYLQKLLSKREDRESIRQKVLIRKLICFKSNPPSGKCGLAFWFEFMTMYEKYRSKASNIQSYLNNIREGLIAECKGSWENETNLDTLMTDKIYLFTDDENLTSTIQQTFDQIQSLKARFAVFVDKELTGPILRSLENLTNLSDLTKDKCKEEAFEHFDDLIYQHSSSSVNILPYIEYWRKMQMNFCRKEFDFLISK